MKRGLPAVLMTTIAASYLLFTMEWLFFVTKPSFLSTVNWMERLLTLLVSPLGAALGALLPAAILAALALLFPAGRLRSLLLVVALVPAGLLLAGLYLLLVDNFTYTVFGFGVRTTIPGQATAASIGLVAGTVAGGLLTACRLFRRFAAENSSRVGALALMPVLVLSLGARALVSSDLPFQEGDAGSSRRKLPNILLVGSDGVESEHMSVYGYSRDTTPFLSRFADEALVCENAFANAGATGSSLVSMFSSKLPPRIRVFYPPDILRGDDSYQHLPGLLRKAGYRSISLTLRHYADAYDLNLREGFDEVNYRKIESAEPSRLVQQMLGNLPAYFSTLVQGRLTERLLHIFGYQAMSDAFDEATQAKTPFVRDSYRLKRLFEFIDEGGAPFFAHVHLMATHGAKFQPRTSAFSEGQEQTEQWSDDFFDDAILTFDQDFQQVINQLEQRNLLEETIVVVYSDHARRFRTWVRLPLLIRFPGGVPRARVTAPVQNLDLAPTLLAYLAMPIPVWMEGRSLLSGNLGRTDPIFGARPSYRNNVLRDGRWQLDTSGVVPPFYSMGEVTLAVCQNWFSLRLDNLRFSGGIIEGYVDPCIGSGIVPEPPAALQMILRYLQENGYDTASIPADLPFRQ